MLQIQYHLSSWNMNTVLALVVLFVACGRSKFQQCICARNNPYFNQQLLAHSSRMRNQLIHFHSILIYRDIRILLHTRSNRNNPLQLSFRNISSIRNSPFVGTRPTRILIHGWLEDDGADINTQTSQELLNLYDFNVLFIDWSKGATTINYAAAVDRVYIVGTFIASYLDFLHENGVLTYHRTSIIGFSLGAHIAGVIGKNVQHGRISTIIGLDPAGPLFNRRNATDRIDAADADYVQCIHTNGPAFPVVGAGIGAPICDSDFFPNGGEIQPGCLTNSCSHGRAVDYYVESLRNNAFFALGCEQRNSINSQRCEQTPGGWMGNDPFFNNRRLFGSFFLKTNRNSPFAQGPRA